jgi:hypothetical protein
MRLVTTKLKPTSGFAHLTHQAILVALPIAVFILVQTQFVPLAVALVILSKWRILAVRPRFWPVVVRANAVDIIFGISMVLFMAYTGSLLWQIIWAVAYGAWLIAIKPSSSTLMISAQAFLGQLAGLIALFLTWPDAPLYALVPITGVVCYLAAHHFFDNFDEPYAKFLSYLWGYFGAALVWLLSHWLLFYGLLAQPVLILSVLGYGLAVLYYFDHYRRLSIALKRQLIAVMVIIILFVLIFSDWSNKVV